MEVFLKISWCSVPGVVAGHCSPEIKDDPERYIWYVSNKRLHDDQSDKRVDFLTELWVTCFERTANESQLKFLAATRAKQRIKELPNHEGSEFQEKLKELTSKLAESARKYREELQANRVEFEERLKRIEEKYNDKMHVEWSSTTSCLSTTNYST